jgi:hypothetical protein
MHQPVTYRECFSHASVIQFFIAGRERMAVNYTGQQVVCTARRKYFKYFVRMQCGLHRTKTCCNRLSQMDQICCHGILFKHCAITATSTTNGILLTAISSSSVHVHLVCVVVLRIAGVKDGGFHNAANQKPRPRSAIIRPHQVRRMYEYPLIALMCIHVTLLVVCCHAASTFTRVLRA